LQRIEFYTIDLTKVKGKGEFTCPKCGTIISPDDRTENVYTIIEPVVENESLKKLIIKCNSCGSQIHLTGFDLLD
jgi:predicted RNA-binding Zn-ribbon protein involved in translation (DUF1610 family)